MSTEKLQEKIDSLKSHLSEERELRKAAQRELNETRKLLGKAQSLAAKMGKACADLNEAVNEGEDAAPKKGGDKKVKAGKTDKKAADKPSKKGGDKKVKADKPKKVFKIVEADDDEDEAPAPKKVKKGGDKKVKAGKTDKKVADKPSKKDKGDKLSKKDKGDKSEVKKGKSDKKGKGKSSKVVDLDDTYED